MPKIRTPNKPIGECPCPFQGCAHSCRVFKYRARSDSEARRRFAGKFYIVCPLHGRTSDQEWILEKAKIDGDAYQPKTEDATVPDPKEPKKPDPKKPAPKPDQDDDDAWTFFD